MATNFLKILFRGFLRDKYITLLNLGGLAIGMACCMCIALYYWEETHFDRHHPKGADLYELGTVFTGTRDVAMYNTSSPTGPVLQEAFPEIESSVRLLRISDLKSQVTLSEPEGQFRSFNESNGFFADSAFFRLFAYDFVEGDPRSALNEPAGMVISEAMAHRFFGNTPALRRTLRLSSDWFEGGDIDCRVTGVFREPQKPTHINAGFFVSMNSGGIGQYVAQTTNLVSGNLFQTYLQLKPGTDPKPLESKINSYFDAKAAEYFKLVSFRKKQFLTPIAEVHLSGINSVTPSGNAGYLHILGTVALFILLIAGVNFMNLATARSARRASEIGVRKTLGAQRSSLIFRYLSESVLLAGMAFVLALGLSQAALPPLNTLSGNHLSFGAYPELWPVFGAMPLLAGVLAGLYPALFLSSFQAVRVLKGSFSNPLSATFLRKGLIVFQFVISAGLLAGSLVVWQQMRFLQTSDLGFTKDQQVIMPLLSPQALQSGPALQHAIQNQPEVLEVGASKYYPGILHLSDMGLFKTGQTVADAVTTRLNQVDADFLKTLQFRLIAGRSFSPEFPADTMNNMILNETAVRELGFSSPAAAIGQPVFWRDQSNRFEVVGVVADFHFAGLHEPIEPFGFQLARPLMCNYLIAHVRPQKLAAALNRLHAIWQQQLPGEPFEYSLLDADFQKNYASDRQMSILVGLFTGLAAIISCLGLLGLSAFTVERRSREIGIRKVLGATTLSILQLLTTEFLVLVGLAVLLGLPLAWYFLSGWLRQFAYQIELQWWWFAAAAGSAIGMALLTISFQCVKAALTSPVRTLYRE